MIKRPFLLLLAAVLAVPATVALAQGAAQAPRDWTRTVAATPEGGFRMGNPDAPVKVVEYLSLTCPHCAAFAREGTPQLVRNFVRSGRVSLEYRNLVLNGPDVVASMLARCGGTANFFPMAERIYATQEQWTGRLRTIPADQRTAMMAMNNADRMLRLAELSGLTAIAAQHGVPAAQSRRCLADEAAFNRLGQMAQAATSLGVNSTPTFLINGTKAVVNDWASFEALIRQAGG